MQWSDAQLTAIETRRKNMLVAAAAGSGKTAVLVERIIQRIVSGECDVDRLLVVTFTNAAAAEMRQRVESALQTELGRNPGSERLERQLVLLSNASISTMHAFCQNVIRQNFAAIDLDPKFRLANEQELALIRQDVLESLFEERYEAQQQEFLRFTEEYGSEHGDELLYELVLKLFYYAQSQPFPEEWLEALPDQFELSDGAHLADTVWMPVAEMDIRQVLDSCAEETERLMEQAGRLACEFYLPVLQSDRELVLSLQEAMKKPVWDDRRAVFFAAKFAVLRAPKGTDDEIKALFSKPREKIKKKIAALQQKYFASAEDELLADLRATAPGMRVLCALTLEFAAQFAAVKKERTLVDFNDLEHFALQILQDASASDRLKPSETALALRQRYQEVMVDEYQDTNGVQEAILSLVQNPARRNLFAVGDVKQSIYRFRLADPSLFLQKYQHYPKLGEGYVRVDLAQNFRSRPEILSAINFLFAQVMVPGTMELCYDEAAALHPGPDYPPATGPTLAGPVELDLIDRDDCAEGGEAGESAGEEDAAELKGFALEAQHIANRLHELMESGVQVFDKAAGGYRGIQWKDIVILLRSVKGKADVLLEILRNADIPAYASVDAGYFEETEVRVMLALLSVLDNSRQDIPLAAVLYSPIGGFRAAELAELRLAAPQSDLFGTLLQANDPASALSDGLREKAAIFLRKLAKWRSLARRVGVPELVWQLYRDTGYYDYVGGMPGGLLRQANLRMLCDRAADYEQTNFRGLFRFLRFIDKIQSMENDLSVARTLGENEDVVRIMSVHKSKGLEFPVVVVADLGKKFNLMDARDELLIHRELGLGPYRTELEHSLRYPTFAREAVAARIVQENKAEEMRVLYVALTRAREKLILSGSGKNLAAKAAGWCRYIGRAQTCIPDHAALDADCYLDWLCMAAARHADGGALRELSGSTEQRVNICADNPSHWKISIVPAASVRAGGSREEDEDPLLCAVGKRELLPGTDQAARVQEVLAWQYDLRGTGDVAAKLSVTELKRRFAAEELAADSAAVRLSEVQEEPGTAADAGRVMEKQGRKRETAFQRPAFMREGVRLTGTEYGTILHSVMQHMDLQKDLTAAGIEKQLDELAAREVLLPVQRQAVKSGRIAQFFASSLGRRMQQAKTLWRELPFSRMLQASRFYPEVQDETEQIFIQGIIDVLFEEEDGCLVLLDYKTDRDTDAERIAARYALQIQLYSEAIEAILGKKIKERYLYLLHDNSIVAM